MARQAAKKVYTSFQNGLVSGANELSFPENSAKAISNFDILDNGSIRVRKGLENTSGAAVDSGNLIGSGATSDYNIFDNRVILWENVAGYSGLDIAVVKIGQDAHFYFLTDDKTSLTDNQAAPSIIIGHSAADREYDAVSGKGFLWTAGPSSAPRKLSFTPTDPNDPYQGGTVSMTILNLKVRDTEVWYGSDDEETGLTRTGSISFKQDYNLRNGGWPYSCNVSQTKDPNAGVTASTDPVEYTNTKLSFYPNIQTPFYVGRAGGGSTIDENEAYSPWRIETDYFGYAIPPVGRFILDAFDVDRYQAWLDGGSVSTGVTASAGEQTAITPEGYPKAIAFYAGRVWYAGAEGKEFVSKIYFSQIIQRDEGAAEKCYQQADPTVQDVNDIVATDGGVINIEGMGDVKRMVPFGPSLIVFSETGVWEIVGKDLNSFTPTSFSINKVSEKKSLNSKSIISTKNSVFFAGVDALYAVVKDSTTGLNTVIDTTSDRVKEIYESIPIVSKKESYFAFNESKKLLYFLYSKEIALGTFDNYLNTYDTVLVLNTDLGAFYTYDLQNTTNGQIVSSIFYDDGYVNSDRHLKFLRLTQSGSSTIEFSFSAFINETDFTDHGTGYTAYIETGFDSLEDIIEKSKKTPVIVCHFERTETGFEDDGSGNLVYKNPSSAILKYRWDWAETWNSGEQVYKYLRNYIPSGAGDPLDYDRDLITTRTRLRGRGTSIGFRFESEAGKDLRLLGFGIYVTQRTGRP